MSGNVTAVVGLQYGDEGKGKIVDYLAEKSDIIVRANGGANAGHTIVRASGEKLALHQIPSGIVYPDKDNIIASGCFLDPVKLVEEIEDARDKGVKVSPENLWISNNVHIVLPIHKEQDAAREKGKDAQATTKSGIAFVAADKALRKGIRGEQVILMSQTELEKLGGKEFAESVDKIKRYFNETVSYLHSKVEDGNDILLEGAQAFGLDINYGKYPYVTSSDTTVSGLLSGSGLNYRQLDRVVGVAKAIPSKVGGGVFMTRITDEKLGAKLRGEKGKVDSEYGATTGREREVGYLDLVALRGAVKINGVSELVLTKFDCVNRYGAKTKVAVDYKWQEGTATERDIQPTSDLWLKTAEPIYKEFGTWNDPYSKEAKTYIKFIEDYLGVPVTMLGTGPNRQDLIIRSK